MFSLSRWMRSLDFRQGVRRSHTLNFNCIISSRVRSYADKPKTDKTSKQLKPTTTGTENHEERMRVRRARPSDIPRVLQFVREHARLTWPGLGAPPAAPQIMLCDYVLRALAQGHSMLAEQHETRRGWPQLCGLALGSVVCPWDATMIEKWSRCLLCTKSKRMMKFQANCLRAPALHEKYRVHNILQVILIVPEDSKKGAEIVSILAKNAIKRGKEVGLPLVRLDVTHDSMAKSLEDLHLKKEWELTYDIVHEATKSAAKTIDKAESSEKKTESSTDKGFIAVYTVKPTEKHIT